jgi:hypothetical protein
MHQEEEGTPIDAKAAGIEAKAEAVAVAVGDPEGSSVVKKVSVTRPLAESADSLIMQEARATVMRWLSGWGKASRV